MIQSTFFLAKFPFQRAQMAFKMGLAYKIAYDLENILGEKEKLLKSF